MTTLLPAPQQPGSRVRPTGPTFVGLVGVELRRLWWRRLARVLAVVVLLVTGVLVYNAYVSTNPEQLAQRVEQYRMLVADAKRQQAEMKEQLPQRIEECRQTQAAERERTGDPSIDFGCEQLADVHVPTPEEMGILPPVADAVTATLATSSVTLLALGAFVLGAGSVGAEFTTGSMSTWLTFQPRRVRVALSKLVAAALGGAVLAGLSLAAIVGGARMIAVVNRPDAGLDLTAIAPYTESIPQLLARVLAVAVLGAVVGASVAFVVRHTAAAVGALLGYAVLVEVIAVEAFLQGRVRPWTVSHNVSAFVERGTTYFAEACTPDACVYGEHPLSYTHGWVYLLVLGVASVVVALVVFRRRDVP
jgi:ABC-2 type transport system permease protein